MRILKFRAWDKQDKRWVCNVYEDEPFEIYLNGDYLGLAGSANDWQGSERYELSQFTGLHDEGGYEIWEGDIVMVINYLNGKPWTGHVHPCAVESVPGGFELKDHWHHESLRSSELEVIGNIYEHPDLLK